jgi:predicted secreted protein
MHRGRKMLVVVHCLLNANAKVYPLAGVSGVYKEVLEDHLASGAGLIQLPCPELTYLGVNRWGMTREQYDHPNFRAHCEAILQTALHEMEAFVVAGYEIVGIVGMDGSPNCGVRRTCTGYTGGEMRSGEEFERQLSRLNMVEGRGVFMEVLEGLLKRRNLHIPLLSVDEENPMVAGS